MLFHSLICIDLTFFSCTSPVLPINDSISPLAAPLPISGLHPLLATTNFQFWKGKASWEGCYVCKKCWESKKTDPFSNLKCTFDIKMLCLWLIFLYELFLIAYCFPLIWSPQTIFFRSAHAERLQFRTGSLKDVNLKLSKSEGEKELNSMLIWDPSWSAK